MVGPCTCHSLCQNFFLIGKDELIGGASRALTNNSGISTPTFAVSRTPSSASALAAVVGPAFTNKLFKQFIKTYLEAQTQPA